MGEWERQVVALSHMIDALDDEPGNMNQSESKLEDDHASSWA